jgi:hypothetical protein
VVGAKTLEQLLLGEYLPTAGIGGHVSYVGRRSRRRQSKAIERFFYCAGCLTVSSQKTHSDGFLYFSGRPLEVDRRLREGFDDGAKSRLAA